MAEKEASKPKLNEKNRQAMMLIEAALYVAGRPLDLETLSSITGVRSKRRIRSIARTLAKAYKDRDTALEILELEDHRFVMQLKPIYSPKVRRLAIKPLLTKGPLKTLSYIAYRQPISQRQVVEIRGSHAYRHIKLLMEMGLVEWEDKDLRILKTTEFFADYFGLSHNPTKMKRQLRRLFEELMGKGES